MLKRAAGDRQRWIELCEAMSLGALIGASGALFIELMKRPERPSLPPAA
jgi:hypothetical protein